MNLSFAKIVRRWFFCWTINIPQEFIARECDVFSKQLLIGVTFV